MNKFEEKLEATKFQRQYLRSCVGEESFQKLKLGFDLVTSPICYVSAYSNPTPQAPYLKCEKPVKETTPPIKAYKQVCKEVQRVVVGKTNEIKLIAQHIFLRQKRYLQLKEGVPFEQLPGIRSIMVAGESGSGKSYIVNQVCKSLGCEYINIPMTSITGPGWKGGNLNEFLKHAQNYQRNNEDGFIVFFFDEIDKHASNLRTQHTEKSFNPLNELLPILDCPNGRYVSSSSDNNDFIELDTNRCAFIFAGAFTGIEEQILLRLGSMELVVNLIEEIKNSDSPQAVFRRRVADIRTNLTLEDLVAYGMSNEFMSRCNMLVNIPQTTEQEYRIYLAEGESSVLSKFKHFIKKDCSLTIRDTALQILIEKGMSSTGGFRVAESFLEPTLGELALLPFSEYRSNHIELYYNLEKDIISYDFI